jgi:hypothetical protein
MNNTHTPLSLSLFISHIYFVVLFLIVISRTTAKEIKKKKKYPLLPFRFFLFFSFVTLACCAAARVFDIIITFGLFFDYFCGLHHLYLLITSFFVFARCRCERKWKKLFLVVSTSKTDIQRFSHFWFVDLFEFIFGYFRFVFRLGLLLHQLHQACKPKSFLTDSL